MLITEYICIKQLTNSSTSSSEYGQQICVRPTNQNGKTYNACVQNTTTANSFCGKQQFIKTHKNPF